MLQRFTFARAEYSEYDNDAIPAHSFVRSVFNITVEQGWRPLYHKELSNITVDYEQYKPLNFHLEDELHKCVPLLMSLRSRLLTYWRMQNDCPLALGEGYPAGVE